ncbi:MAG: DUF1501 domain-containing protein [Polyangiales bacterium]
MNQDDCCGRRGFLKMLGGGAAAALAAAPIYRALAEPSAATDEFFIFVHAQGGWDVTVGLDPRNERKGLVEPANDDLMDPTPLTQWKSTPLDADTNTFQIVTKGALSFGPSIGDLLDYADRLTVINGLAMNTVSHPDGTVFSSTGRHLAGGRAAMSSIDTLVANEFGLGQLFPLISARFPSYFTGNTNLDRRATPLVVDSIGSIGRVLTRSNSYEMEAQRTAVTALLSQEATDLAKIAYTPDAYNGLALQYQSLTKMVGSSLKSIFDTTALKTARPEFNYAGKFQGANAVNAAFALEAMRSNVVRCVSFQLGGFDTHNGNYRDQAATQQEAFNVLAAMLKVLDATPHPTKTADKLADHTHILVVSDFCRTPQINLSGGRDHYPNNSSLIISPKFKGGMSFGKTDPEQLLPMNAKVFADGERPVAPPDVLATFLAAQGIDPRKYLRDGDTVSEILK